MGSSVKTVRLRLDEQHPFARALYDGSQVALANGFADRTSELRSIERYIKRPGVLGIQGSLGSGKTTLLNHFFLTKLPPDIPVVFLQLGSAAHERPFSQIAASVLRLCVRRKKKGKIKISASLAIDFAKERKRLEGELRERAGLKIEIAPEVEIPNILKVKVGSISREVVRGSTETQHGYDAAIDLLRELIHKSETRFYVILDDFHYLRSHVRNEDYYLDFVLFADTVNRVLSHRNVTFIVTLDDLVLRKRQEAEKSGGGRAYSYTDEEITVTGFSPAIIGEMINRRLALFEFPDGTRPSFSDAAIALTCLASEGNPRAALDVLRRAWDLADDDETMDISLEYVERACNGLASVSVDAKDIKILKFLRDHGPTAVGNRKFQRFVGKSRSTLSRDIPALEALGVVVSQTGGTAKNPTEEYYIPAIEKWPS